MARPLALFDPPLDAGMLVKAAAGIDVGAIVAGPNQPVSPVRAQWGVNGIPLFELERAWDQPQSAAPLPVTLGSQMPRMDRPIRTVDDVRAAIVHYVQCIPYGRLLATAQHISTDISFPEVTERDMVAALAPRAEVTPIERDVYASFIQEAFLTELETHADEIVYQFSLGAEPLPFETGSKIRQGTIYDLAARLARHPPP